MYSAIGAVCEPLSGGAMQHMEEAVLLFCCGYRQPVFARIFFTAALRASEMNCDALLKGHALLGFVILILKKIRLHGGLTLSYMDVLSRDLKVMDASAISLSHEQYPHFSFSISDPGGFQCVLQHDGAFVINEAGSR